MTHGVLAIDHYDNNAGVAIWELASLADEPICIAAPRGVEDSQWDRNIASIWDATLTESLGDVRWVGAQSIEYGRYAPDKQAWFCQLCWDCTANTRWAIVLPSATPSLAVARMIEDFLGGWRDLEERLWAQKAVKPVAIKLVVRARWVCLVGFSRRFLYTTFLSEDYEVVNMYAHIAAKIPGFKISQQW